MYSRHYETTRGVTYSMHRQDQRDRDCKALEQAKAMERRLRRHFKSRTIDGCIVTTTTKRRLDEIEELLKNRKYY